MILHVAYYSITFIIALVLIGKIASGSANIIEEREDINRNFAILCLGFIFWSMCIVTVGVSQNDVIDHIFLLVSDFMRMGILVTGIELFAVITDVTLGKKRQLYAISSELLYFAVATLVVRIFFDRAAVADGMFGSYLVIGKNFGLVIYILFHIVLLFFYGAYTYMYSYTCTKKRDYYILKQCIIIAGIIAACLAIESFVYIKDGDFVPTMYVGVLVGIICFRKLILYKRSIEYNEKDYERILAPSHTRAAFVCDDEGRIIFENTRASVMKQTYKDEYIDKFLTDVFEITDYDLERLKDSRITQIFEVYCKYPKQDDMPTVLYVRHKLDKFGTIFATEVEVGNADEEIDESNFVDTIEPQPVETVKEEISIGVINEIRTEALIKQLEYQKKLYEDNNRHMFLLNLKGISKTASVLGLTALEELCSRIHNELIYGEWEGLDSMIIELDRQYETLKLINS